MRLNIGLLSLLVISSLDAQTQFNAWLTSCAHLIGPTGNVRAFELALEQSRGARPDAPAFHWDMLVDVGDWTASQHPPTHEDGAKLTAFLDRALNRDRSRYFTVSGNHDGEARGWTPGEFARRYVKPLRHLEQASGPVADDRSSGTDAGVPQILRYPGTRWDRYLIRSGNVIWIMLGDRNEFDTLAEARGDTTGRYQAGRGSAAGMPMGGYPSGAVTRDTFEWWRTVVEDAAFSADILITAHHLLPRNTTITTDDGEPGNYHGRSGSIGPNGEVGGQLYWVREYDDSGREVRQYAQTRPFLDYLRDRPGAIAAWIGGHTHIDAPEQVINGRGIYARKHGVTFISVGALTDSHAGGSSQLSRMLSFRDGSDEAIVNVYVHLSKDGRALGWQESAARRVPLGKAFRVAPTRGKPAGLLNGTPAPIVSEAPADPFAPRYYWDLDADRGYDFNNLTHVIGADGSPFGEYQLMKPDRYTGDSPFAGGRSLDFRGEKGRVQFSEPYQPTMEWSFLTLSCWLQTSSKAPQEPVSYSASDGVGKFRLLYDGSAWVFEVGEENRWRSARWTTDLPNRGQHWYHFVAVADASAQRVALYVDGQLRAEADWTGGSLKRVENARFVIGGSGDIAGPGDKPTWVRSYDGMIDEVMVFDSVVDPHVVRSLGVLR